MEMDVDLIHLGKVVDAVVGDCLCPAKTNSQYVEDDGDCADPRFHDMFPLSGLLLGRACRVGLCHSMA